VIGVGRQAAVAVAVGEFCCCASPYSSTVFLARLSLSELPLRLNYIIVLPANSRSDLRLPGYVIYLFGLVCPFFAILCLMTSSSSSTSRVHFARVPRSTQFCGYLIRQALEFFNRNNLLHSTRLRQASTLDPQSSRCIVA
jgi:hypothetical protein